MAAWLVPLAVALTLSAPPALVPAPPGMAAHGARVPAAASTASRPRWSWPLEPSPAVTHPFVRPVTPYGPGHRGVDLTPTGGSVDVLSPARGVVTFAGAVAGRPVVVVSHAGGLRSTFEPVRAIVRVGTLLDRGQVIGALSDGPAGLSHCAPAECLHWGVIRGSVYLDPLSLVTAARVVLRPLD